MNCVSFIEALVDQGHKVHSALLCCPSSTEVTQLTWGVPRAVTTRKIVWHLPAPAPDCFSWIGDKSCTLRNPHINLQALMEWGEIAGNQCQPTLPPIVLWISMSSSAVSFPGCHKGSNSGTNDQTYLKTRYYGFLNPQQLQQPPTEQHLYKLLLKRNFYENYRRRKISIFPANQMKAVTTM